MNQNSQLDLHPDAESLNAFAEQTLAEREHEQILAHLALCSRCRQVVCLAQEAAAEQDAATETLKARSAVWSGAWLRNWRIAWVPAAALAATIALVVFVHQRRAETGSDVARVEPPAAPQIEQNLTMPSAQPRAVKTNPSPVPTRSAIKSLKPPAPAFASEPLPQHFFASAPLSSQAESIELPNSVHELAALPLGMSRPDVLTRGQGFQFKPEAVVSARQLQQALGAAQSHAATARAMQPARSNEAQGRRILTSAVPAPQYEARTAIPGPIEVSRQTLMAGIPSVHLTKTTALPSGLPAVSTAISRHCLLAIDTAGELFWSEDFGNHWTHVDRQWTGRAVAVHLRSDVKVNDTPAVAGLEQDSSANGAEAFSMPAAVFEIVNDSGKVWVSRNGKTWKMK